MEHNISNNEILKNVLENSDHIVIFALDSEYRYVFFNKNHSLTMKKIWGCDISTGQNMLDYISNDEDRIKARKNFDRALSGESFHMEEDYGDGRFERRYYNNIYNPIKDDRGAIKGLSVILTDITEEVNIKKALKESNALKDKLFNIIAHDLRGPLSNLYGLGEILVNRHEEIDQKKREMYLKFLLNNTKTSFALIDNLLKWARSNSGLMKYEPGEINVKQLVNESIHFFEANAESKMIEIENLVIDDITAYADYEMINTVMRNLLSNALKFSPRNGRISIRAELTDENAVRVSVKDGGVGIPDDIQPKLFCISDNVTTPGTENEKGTGFGLVISKEFVDKHGGEIWVDSIVNEGSSFHFTIPHEQKAGA